jgi:hypothetical protein
VIKKKANKLHEEAQKCVHVANRTTDDKLAAALLAYACELEQRARLIENAKKPIRSAVSVDQAGSRRP